MRIISLTQNKLQDTVQIAADSIKRGNILIAPTDTVYGIIANACDEKAIKKVYLIKKRDIGKPLPIFIKNIAMAKKLALITPKQERYLEEKWPGKLTAILKRRHGLKIYGTLQDTIALRIPFYCFINSLLETLNLPLCGTSANISGQPASVKIDTVIGQFGESYFLPDIIINAGDLAESKPSAIIDFTKQRPFFVRK